MACFQIPVSHQSSRSGLKQSFQVDSEREQSWIIIYSLIIIIIQTNIHSCVLRCDDIYRNMRKVDVIEIVKPFLRREITRVNDQLDFHFSRDPSFGELHMWLCCKCVHAIIL